MNHYSLDLSKTINKDTSFWHPKMVFSDNFKLDSSDISCMLISDIFKKQQKIIHIPVPSFSNMILSYIYKLVSLLCHFSHNSFWQLQDDSSHIYCMVLFYISNMVLSNIANTPGALFYNAVVSAELDNKVHSSSRDQVHCSTQLLFLLS